jgi:hypothetical protein
MIATTPMSALPAIVARGTMGAGRRADSIGGAELSTGDAPLCSVTELVVDMQATIMQDEATRIEPVHETDVVRRDDH